MSVQNLFFYMIVFANVISLLHLLFFVVGANVYDSIHFRRQAIAARKRRYTRRAIKQPMVSVVVPAHNEEMVIKRTIDSILGSTYQNIEIIVVDDGSTDRTAAVAIDHMRVRKGLQPLNRKKPYATRTMRRLRKNRTTKRMVLISQRNGGKARAMNRAIRYHVRGELTMSLDADSILHPQAIEKAVAYFRNKDVIGVAANVRIMGGRSWLSQLQRFEHMIGYRAKKFYTLTASEFIVGGVASTYRTKLLRKHGGYDTDTMTEDIGLSLKLIEREGNRKKRIVYAADVVAMTEGVQTYAALMRQRYRWKMGSLQNLYKYRHLFANQDNTKYTYSLTRYRLPMSLVAEAMLILEPMLFVYIVYISIVQQSLTIILGAYATITLYTLWTIWPDEHLSILQKIRMSILSLGMYIIFYAMNVVQFAAVIRCLINRQAITGAKPTGSVWISPARSGQQAANF